MTTTTTRAPFSTVDLLVLRIDATQTCSVVENQWPGDTHVKIWRINRPAPELIRNEDVMPLGSRETRHD